MMSVGGRESGSGTTGHSEVTHQHLKVPESRAKYLPVMSKRLLQRLCAAMLVLAFVVGLPMQGTAMTCQVSLAATSGIPVPDGCDACGDNPTANNCPVFCTGLSAIVPEKQELAPIPLVSASGRIHDAVAGLSRSPDPYPPRTSFLS